MQYLQLVEGMTPLRAALWQVPGVLVMMAASALAAPMAKRVRPAFVIAGGPTLAVAGLLVVAQADVGTGLGVVLVGVALAGPESAR